MLNLPTELTLNILSYLPFLSLSRLQVVCRSWKEFCNFHESTIYRNAAYLHGYIPCPTTALNELSSVYSPRVLETVNTWKDLCRRRLEIQYNWKGKGPSTVVEHKSTSPEWTQLVHRIKVDELAGYVMTTSNKGGILVTDLNEDRILWALPQWYVRAYAHLEYGQGYMIFDRPNGDKEVWRRLSDVSEHDVDEFSTSDTSQHEVYEHSSAMNGLFRPWAVLHMPELTNAFRFVYPTLIVAAYDRAYLWDVPSGRLIQTLQGCQSISSEDGFNQYLQRIMYVEISERHVFLAGQYYLRIFSRATGKSVWDLPSSERGYGFWTYTPATPHDRMPGSALVRYMMAPSQESYDLRSNKRVLYDKFVSVHVSACGRHFAALLRGCRLFVVYDFEEVSTKEELYRQTLDIQLPSHGLHESIYLAFDYGRISVVTTSGVFIVEVDNSNLGKILIEPPILSVCRVFPLTNEASLDEVSCLMLSDTGLYVTWNPNTVIADEDDEPGFDTDAEPPPLSLSTVFSVNFARY